MLSKENLNVLTNIIGAVESGGQVYGRRNYAAYTPPYTNSELEHTITLGWAQNYGSEAERLIEMIANRDPSRFHDIDVDGIVEKMLGKDWVALRWNPDDEQRRILIELIDSKIGRLCQDELFAELMTKYVADCEKSYTNFVKAVMMYCEIRHLGGKGSADRIFKRCNGLYGLEYILASLLKDQRDTSSDNQVGDKKFWGRHVKCAQFAEEYAISEESTVNQNGSNEVEKMATVLVGSARGDEYGEASGGRAGDQTGREVSTQVWYYHPKGWVDLRPKDDIVAERIALAMEKACRNNNIGYDQGQRDTLYSAASMYGFDPEKVKTPVETDCSALVRVCLAYAGIKVGDIYTGNLKDKVLATGKFTQLPDSQTHSADYMKRGDILVTKTVGHTVVVLGTGSKVKPSQEVPVPTKSIDEIAKEVIDGKWGNGDERKEALTKAGYNYEEVRKKVNSILAGEATSQPVSEYPKHGVVNVDGGLNVRTGPAVTYPIYKPYPLLGFGNEVDVLGKEGGFYKILIAGKHTAYASAKYIDV